MHYSRRTVLGAGGTLAVSLAGCLDSVSADDPSVGLALYNYTDQSQQLKVELLREDRDDRSDALAFGREFDVPPPADGDSASVLREDDVAQRRRYLVRVLLRRGRGEWDHHHYYPGESATDAESERIDVRIYRDEETGELYTRFG